MLRRLGAVQLDTISVLARSHELVAYARLGAVGAAEGREGLLGRRRLRVLVARRLRAAGRGVAAVRLPPALLPRPRLALARGAPGRLPARARRPARQRADDGDRARRRAPRRRVVGLVGRQDRRRVAARRRRRRVHRAPRVEARLRPARARPAAGGAGRRPRRRARACAGWSARPASRSAWRRSATWPTTTASSAIRSGRCSTRPTSCRSTVEGWRDDGVGRSRRAGGARRARAPSHHAAVALRLAGVGPRADAARLRLPAPPRGLRARRPSACTATSRCRCWPAGACAAASIPGARARRWWPSACRASRARSTTWPRRCARPRSGSAATPSRCEAVDPPELAAPLRAALARLSRRCRGRCRSRRCCRCRRCPLLRLPPLLPAAAAAAAARAALAAMVVAARCRRRGVVAAGAVVVVLVGRPWASSPSSLAWPRASAPAAPRSRCVLAGARRTPEPTGVGASPIESREIALAASPTATARREPDDGEDRGPQRARARHGVTVAGSLGRRRAPARRRPGSAARPECRRRGGR